MIRLLYSINQEFQDLKNRQNDILNTSSISPKNITDFRHCQVITSPNIAIIKYWGKLDDDRIIPLNSSLGFTLSNEDISTTTNIEMNNLNTTQKELLIINEKPHPLNSRLRKLISHFTKDNEILKVNSVNNFPTKSGLASSASGMSALSIGLNCIFENSYNQSQLQVIGRMASGSACRSLLGGLVKWQGPDDQISRKFIEQDKTQKIDLNMLSNQCISRQILPATYFKNQLSFLILCDEFKEKSTGSTDGMKKSVQTSNLLKQRLKEVENRLQETIVAIYQKDWNKMIQNTIWKCLIFNQFHAVCLDSSPPIFYLNNYSHQIINMIEYLNSQIPETLTGYTFDAGPHAVLIIQEPIKLFIHKLLNDTFQIQRNSIQTNSKATQIFEQADKYMYSPKEQEIYKEFKKQYQNMNPSYIFHTEVGDGPVINVQSQ